MMSNKKFKIQFYIITLFFICLVTPSFGQKNDDAFFYIDSLGRMGEEANHKFVRVIKQYYVEKDDYQFLEYYRSGKIYAAGTSKDKDILRPNGSVVRYYENGRKKEITNYIDSHITGKQYRWYENGSIQSEKEFSYDKSTNKTSEKVLQFWSPDKTQLVIDGNGIYEAIDEDIVEGFEIVGTVYEKGEIKNGFKHGKWIGNSTRPKISYLEEYDNGKLINGNSTDEDNHQYSYTEVKEEPAPKTGINDFNRYVGKKYNAPNIRGFSGKIYVTFIVDKDGKLTEAKVVRDAGYGTGAEALRVINEAKNWNPGKIRGIISRFFYSLPITIMAN